LHPGVALGTSLAPGFGDEDLPSLVEKDREIGWDRGLDLKTLDECAATHVVAAFDPTLEGFNGSYLEDGHVSEEGLLETGRGEGDAERLCMIIDAQTSSKQTAQNIANNENKQEAMHDLNRKPFDFTLQLRRECSNGEAAAPLTHNGGLTRE
jgi:hypothetical protein